MRSRRTIVPKWLVVYLSGIKHLLRSVPIFLQLGVEVGVPLDRNIVSYSCWVDKIASRLNWTDGLIIPAHKRFDYDDYEALSVISMNQGLLDEPQSIYVDDASKHEHD
jgi:hypothetical protein